MGVTRIGGNVEVDDVIRKVFKVDTSFMVRIANLVGKKKLKYLMGAEVTISYLGGKGYVIKVKDV